MIKNNKKTRLNENALRALLRKEITKILEAEETEKEPEEKEVPEPEEELGLNSKLEAITSNYIRKLKDSGVQVGTEELVEMLSTVIESFTNSSEQKLNVLKTIKTNIVR